MSATDDPRAAKDLSPGFSREPTPALRPGFDPLDSPLNPGGEPALPGPGDTSLFQLDTPESSEGPGPIVRVRRKGWVDRRTAAQSRFAHIIRQRGSSTSRLLAGLNRRGLLQRSRQNAVRRRFALRRTHR